MCPTQNECQCNCTSECHLDLASPRLLRPSGALDEVAVVVAAVYPAVLEAEQPDMVCAAERTLNPTWVDHPSSTCACATLVSSTAGMCCGATFEKAPMLLAAA